MIELLFTGFYIGAIHVIGAPDHLAVLIPLGLLDKGKSWQVGLLWSLGHMIGLVFLGTLFFYFKSLINLSSLEQYNLIYIGVLLILIGSWIAYKSRNIKFNLLGKNSSSQQGIHKVSFGAGILHGFIGISHIYTLAPTLSMNTSDFIYYFLSFIVGTTITVLILTYLLCFIPQKIVEQESLYRKICKWSGIIAITIGTLMLLLHFVFPDNCLDILEHHH